MSRAKAIVLTLAPLGKARKAAARAQGGETVVTPRQQLVHVALVAYVEYEMVTGAVEYPMHSHGQLHRSQIGGQMAAGFGDGVHQRAADLVAQRGHGLGRQSAHVGRGLNMGPTS